MTDPSPAPERSSWRSKVATLCIALAALGMGWRTVGANHLGKHTALNTVLTIEVAREQASQAASAQDHQTPTALEKLIRTTAKDRLIRGLSKENLLYASCKKGTSTSEDTVKEPVLAFTCFAVTSESSDPHKTGYAVVAQVNRATGRVAWGYDRQRMAR